MDPRLPDGHRRPVLHVRPLRTDDQTANLLRHIIRRVLVGRVVVETGQYGVLGARDDRGEAREDAGQVCGRLLTTEEKGPRRDPGVPAAIGVSDPMSS